MDNKDTDIVTDEKYEYYKEVKRIFIANLLIYLFFIIGASLLIGRALFLMIYR